MRSARSINSLVSCQQQQTSINAINNNSVNSPTSPICRCRVMYLGYSVPHITKDGLQGIQEPLRELYPDKSTLATGNAGIDSWLSVWSNGILIENIDETGREVKRFFKIDALHYCAAVKFVSLPLDQQFNSYTTLTNGNSATLPKFLPLDSPHTRQSNSNPPIFASILRRTTGIKVLECHAFICKREAAANALVRCCFHAYADTMYAKQIGADVQTNDINNNINNRALDSLGHGDIKQHEKFVGQKDDGLPMATRRSKSIAALNDADQKRTETWRSNESNIYIKDNAHHQQDSQKHQLERNLMVRRKSMNEHYALDCDNTDHVLDMQQMNNDNLRKQHKLSKSMHHLNQNGQISNATYNQIMKDQIDEFGGFPQNQSTSASCINIPNGRWTNHESRIIQQVPHQPFYNPYASRVPSYPPQNLIDTTNNGGTLRSIRSMATNSIASTLLRSKKHAKAMSMAQLNQDKITSFHQPHSNTSTMGGAMMMPPVPPMFLPSIPTRSILNGSQTMKVQSKPIISMVGPHMNFEAMTPKEMKKLLKKSAKYGIDPSKFGENGLPVLPFRPPPMPQSCHNIPPHSQSGTMVSQSMYSDIYCNEMPDIASIHGFPSRGHLLDSLDQTLMKPILVKPNPEFLKSKAGKKWLKQQKEFKKLLPPHLDGLPIIFGPPPIDALEPATLPNNSIQTPTFIPPQPGVPMMDTSGYYNPHPFYGQNGRSSATSTLLRYSPHSQIIHENSNGPHHDSEYQRNHVVYNNNNTSGPSPLIRKDYISDESSMIFGNNECGVDAHNRQFTDNGHKHQKRNHMVEQSVISLGDENDFDDDEEAPAQHRTFDQQDYDHVIQGTDDQISYSSGFYKRGHINERAFSYSIRQEQNSGGGIDSDAEYTTQNETLTHNHNDQQNQGNMFQNKRDQDDDYYHHDNNQSQTVPVNELTARLENQLNMKSFTNSRIKSHM